MIKEFMSAIFFNWTQVFENCFALLNALSSEIENFKSHRPSEILYDEADQKLIDVTQALKREIEKKPEEIRYHQYVRAHLLRADLLMLRNKFDDGFEILNNAIKKMESFMRHNSTNHFLIYFGAGSLYQKKHYLLNAEIQQQFYLEDDSFVSDLQIVNRENFANIENVAGPAHYYILCHEKQSDHNGRWSLFCHSNDIFYEINIQEIPDFLDSLENKTAEILNGSDDVALHDRERLKLAINLYQKNRKNKIKENSEKALKNSLKYYKRIDKDSISFDEYCVVLHQMIDLYLADYCRENFSEIFIFNILPLVREVLSLRRHSKNIYRQLAVGYNRLGMDGLFAYAKNNFDMNDSFLLFTHPANNSIFNQTESFIKHSEELRKILKDFLSDDDFNKFNSNLTYVIRLREASHKISLRLANQSENKEWVVERTILGSNSRMRYAKESGLLRRCAGCCLEIINEDMQNRLGPYYYSHRLTYQTTEEGRYEWKKLYSYEYTDNDERVLNEINMRRIRGFFELLPNGLIAELDAVLDIPELEKKIIAFEICTSGECFVSLKPESVFPTLVFSYYSKTIQDLLNGSKSVDIYVVHSIAAQLAMAMIYLHDTIRVIHGDLKPSNVLLHILPDGRHCIKITDMECAQVIGGTLSETIGTDQWKAPELLDVSQEKPVPICPGLDLFSLAKIIFYILWCPLLPPTSFNFNNLEHNIDVESLPTRRATLHRHPLWLSCRASKPIDRGTATQLLRSLLSHELTGESTTKTGLATYL